MALLYGRFRKPNFSPETWPKTRKIDRTTGIFFCIFWSALDSHECWSKKKDRSIGEISYLLPAFWGQIVEKCPWKWQNAQNHVSDASNRFFEVIKRFLVVELYGRKKKIVQFTIKQLRTRIFGGPKVLSNMPPVVGGYPGHQSYSQPGGRKSVWSESDLFFFCFWSIWRREIV